MTDLALMLDHAFAAYNTGKLTEAERLCQRIITAEHNCFDALHILAVVQSRLGKKEEALASYDRALQLRPDYTEMLYNLGITLHELKRPEEALASYDRALLGRPDYTEARYARANALRDLKRLDEALTSYDRVLQARPDYAEALSNRGLTLHELKRLDEALASYDRALKVRPDYAEALSNRGLTLNELKRLDEALASYDRALKLRPDYDEALSNRGLTLHELKRWDEALASYDRATQVRPDYAEAHWNEGLTRLLIGDFERGWEKYEWRWKTEKMKAKKRNFAQPLWLGQKEIAGKTILLHAEQGFGDTIQFCRYVPLVAERGARVILEVPKSLHELMNGLAGIAQVVSSGDPLPGFDFHCPLLSLPLALATRLATIPSTTPYLRAPSRASNTWKERLGPKDRRRIGLVWSGNPAHKNDRNRSISLSSLLPLLDVNATFISLQKHVRADDAVTLKARSDLLHFGEELQDFSDTAALISCLDLVISVDTSVAHLAGALERAVWVLQPFIPDWRWLLDRDDNPWYPTARLFRQDETRVWDNVIACVQTALHDLVQSRS
jgi:tetratricopeptide (TPR) repeat protein